MDRSSFLILNPEFSSVPTAMLDAELAGTLIQMDPDVWGEFLDQGHRFLTAHRLALSPYGQQARLVAKDGTTTYGRHYEELLLTVASGHRVC